MRFSHAAIAMLAFAVLALPVHAAEGKFCLAGTSAMSLDSSERELAIVKEKCPPGDTIAIPAGGGGDKPVAMICDFTKSALRLCAD
jgi:hypothetical protein